MTYDPEYSAFEPEPPEPQRDLISRVVNAALLNRQTFLDIRDDPTAMFQVYGLVVAASIASAIGAIDSPGAAVANAVLTFAGWLITVHVAWFLRSFIFDSIHAEASRPELMRVIGIAYGPALLRAFGIIPGIGGVVWAAATIWMLVVIVVGMKATLGFENYWPPIGILVVGALLNALVSMIVFGIF
jgi:hypothetical protein